jgi:hypothetical protein
MQTQQDWEISSSNINGIVSWTEEAIDAVVNAVREKWPVPEPTERASQARAAAMTSAYSQRAARRIDDLRKQLTNRDVPPDVLDAMTAVSASLRAFGTVAGAV